MVEFLLFLLGCSGFTITFMLGSIFQRVRDFIEKHSSFFGEMIYCPLCLGFWVGVAGSFIYNYNTFLSGFSISLVSWIVINTFVVDEED